MNIVYTPHNLDKLPIAKLDGLSCDKAVLWDRDGERRLIPAAVLHNTYTLILSWREARDAGVIEEVPDQYMYIPWDAALPIPQGSARVKIASPESKP